MSSSSFSQYLPRLRHPLSAQALLPRPGIDRVADDGHERVRERQEPALAQAEVPNGASRRYVHRLRASHGAKSGPHETLPDVYTGTSAAPV